MRASAKRLLPIAIGALLLAGLALLLTVPGKRQWRAETMVIVKPYTNVLVSRSFESHFVRTIPGVLSLRVGPSLSAIPGSGKPVTTNGAGIWIAAFGRTPEEAEKVANEAARTLCWTVFTNYGAKGDVVDTASSARKYSFFHDSFEPTIDRMLKP
jgi:hypothetical protein